MRLRISILLLFLGIGTVTAQTHYQYVDITDRNHSFLGLECNIAGVLLEPGDEVAAFDPDGVCAGVGIVGLGEGNDEGSVGIALWGDDSSTHNSDEGFDEDQEITLWFWDRSYELETPVTSIEILEGPERWTDYG